MIAPLTVVLLLATAPGRTTPTAPAAPAADEPLRIRHTPVAEVLAGTDLVLRAQVTSSWKLGALVAHHRVAGESDFAKAPFEKSADGSYVATIRVPPEQRRPVEYYLTAAGTDGVESLPFASPMLPHPVIVQSTEGELEREAILDVYGRRRSRVSLSGEYVSYGRARVGDVTFPDSYYRAEADYLYRLFQGGSSVRIDTIRLGMGTLRGQVPSAYVSGDPFSQESARAGIDYGFSEVELSFHSLFGISAKLLLGGNARGFAPGGGARVRIGRPRGSRVELEGEYISEIGMSGSFRLIWDTVPGLPMSAGGQVTNIPGGPAGVRLIYGIGWELSDAVTLGAQLGYQARQSVGGGLTVGLSSAFAW